MTYIKMSMFRRKTNLSGNEEIVGLDGDNIKISIKTFEERLSSRLQGSYGGVVNTASTPNPDGDMWWWATEAGTYVNFGNVVLPDGHIGIISRANGVYQISIQEIAFDPTKDSLLYPNETDYKSYQYLVNGKIFNSSNSAIWKWTGFLPISNRYDIVFDGFGGGYAQTAFYDENKTFISQISISGGDGTIPKESIPVNAKYIGKNLNYSSGSGTNPDVSQTATIYTKDSLYDTVDERVSRFQSELTINKKDEEEYFEKRHGIVELTSYDDLVYSNGSFLNGNVGPTLGYASLFTNRSRTPFWDIRQVNKIILSGFAPNLPTSRFFYDENLQTLGVIHGVNGVFDYKDFPAGSVYFGFTIEMPDIRLSGNEKVRFVYNGDTPTIEYYKREIYNVFVGTDGIDGQFLTGAGNIVTGANNSWSGYIPIPDDVDLEIDGLLSGFNTKVFWDIDYNMISTTSINNGTISRSTIPPNAAYIGFNTRRTTVGDSRSTARMFFVYDNSGARSVISELPDLAIPSVIPVVVGIQANIYKDNLRPNPINDYTEFFFNEGALKTGNNPNPYIWKTREVERALQYTPEMPETVPIIAMMRDRNYGVLTRRDFQFVGVPETSGNGQRKTIILAGDSQIDTTFDGSKSSFAPYLKDLFDQSGSVEMVFVGAENMSATIYGETAAENRIVNCPTEGQGSTTLAWLIGQHVQSGKNNPFLNASGDFDLPMYWNNVTQPGNPYGLTPSDTLDYFLTPSGTNDFSISGRSPDEVVSLMMALYGLIQSQMPSTKLIIGIPTLGSKLWSMDTRRKWSIDYYRSLIAEFEKPTYSGKVVLAAAGLWTDNLFASRQLRKITEPYQRIVDTKTQLYNKAIQGGMTPEQAHELVNDTYNLRVEERVFEKWMEEYPGTNDVTHSGYVGAMQQADCYYSAIKYAITL